MASDKVGHFKAGLLIALTSGAISFLLGLPAFLLALFASCLAGAAKELSDATGRGTPDLLDFLATAAGGLLGALPFIFF